MNKALKANMEAVKAKYSGILADEIVEALMLAEATKWASQQDLTLSPSKIWTEINGAVDAVNLGLV